MSAENRLRELGVVLPTPATPVAAYVPTRRAGDLLFVSGQIPFREGVLMATGPVPGATSPEQAQAAARQCALNGLAAARAALGSLDRVAGVVRVGVFVACSADFHQHSQVANGASQLLVEVFGEAGRHSRAAVGAPSLPLNASVEVEMVLAVAPGA